MAHHGSPITPCNREGTMPTAVARVLLAFGVTAWALPARAGIALPDPPVPQRAALAGMIVLGRVLEVEDEPAQAYPLLKVPGGPKVAFRIARVRIDSALSGGGKPEEVRVGVGPGRGMPRLEAGQTGCFFLHKHPDE